MLWLTHTLSKPFLTWLPLHVASYVHADRVFRFSAITNINNGKNGLATQDYTLLTDSYYVSSCSSSPLD